MIDEATYARQLQSVCTMENVRMVKDGVKGPRIPHKLLAALVHLQRKGSLTKNDLAHILSMSPTNALALLFRLRDLGLATAEIHPHARILVFTFCRSATQRRRIR